MKIPEFPDFRPLKIDDHRTLSDSLARQSSAMCDLCPANLFIWRDCERPSLTKIHDSLCILIEPHSSPGFFLEPVGGTRRADAVRTCLSRTRSVSRCSKELVDALPAQEFDIRPLRDHFDYIYLRQALAELKGKRFDGKRNQIRKFTRNFPDYDFRPLERSRFGDAMALFGKWSRQRGGRAAPEVPASFTYECQGHALGRAFLDYERLGLVGGAIHIHGELQGFIIASVPRADMVVVHFQYADARLPGIYQVLLRDACRHLFAGCAYVNLEEDLGLAGLRRTKLSYLPIRLEEKYEIRRKSGCQVFGIRFSRLPAVPGQTPEPTVLPSTPTLPSVRQGCPALRLISRKTFDHTHPESVRYAGRSVWPDQSVLSFPALFTM